MAWHWLSLRVENSTVHKGGREVPSLSAAPFCPSRTSSSVTLPILASTLTGLRDAWRGHGDTSLVDGLPHGALQA